MITNHNWKSTAELLREVRNNPNPTPMEYELMLRLAEKTGHK